MYTVVCMSLKWTEPLLGDKSNIAKSGQTQMKHTHEIPKNNMLALKQLFNVAFFKHTFKEMSIAALWLLALAGLSRHDSA